MTLITSISGIRGTIGGSQGQNLTPFDIVKFSAGYAKWILEKNKTPKVVIGRDARMSGALLSNLVASTLMSMGVNVIDLGLSTTPTVEFAVEQEKADGGIILTASHNPKEWNALKLLNHKGEFLSAQDGQNVLDFAKQDLQFSQVDNLGKQTRIADYIERHIKAVLEHPWVNKQAIQQAGFRIAVDGINSTGALAVPLLLEALGVKDVHLINGEMHGDFAHNPEPLKEHLSGLSKVVVDQDCALGIVVDPDVDRLAFMCENGEMFGEEYTLVAIADYVLGLQKGAAVSNLSSTKALADVAKKHGCMYHASAVGEVNVVAKMKEVDAIIGGEGNGGIIVPNFHYGRDALIGIALFLSHLAEKKQNISELRSSYPNYFMSKSKIQLNQDLNPEDVLHKIKNKYTDTSLLDIDGVKLLLNDHQWVHMRKSNTEPIIRVYTESNSQSSADDLAKRFVDELLSLA